jgi:hypothetical protein
MSAAGICKMGTILLPLLLPSPLLLLPPLLLLACTRTCSTVMLA